MVTGSMAKTNEILLFSLNITILKAKSNFTLFIYIHFQDICEDCMKSV